MRSRRRATWLVFGVCVAIVAFVLGLVTWQALRLERQEQRARAQAEREEDVRLALWRMDSLLTPIIAREAARPYFHYRSFYPVGRAYTRMWQPVTAGDVMAPSPLLTFPAPVAGEAPPGDAMILLHFQVESDGRVTSPQVPTGNMLDLAESGLVPPERVAASESLLSRLASRLPAGTVVMGGADEELGQVMFDQLAANAPTSVPAGRQAGAREDLDYMARQRNLELLTQNSQPLEPAPATQPQLSKAEAELAALDDAPSRGLDVGIIASESDSRDSLYYSTLSVEPADSGVELGPLTGTWVDGDEPMLLFIREARVGDQRVTQGFWADWAALSAMLLDSARDLLPAASLQPALAGADAPTAGLLATAPVRLDPGPPAPLASVGFTPTRATLVFSWLALVAAAVAIGLVLRAAIQLSERRFRFVSAVTHELRTPLTTFRLYAQMLADGMVSDDTARREYLATLKNESGRLAGIVENVLEYARLSRRRTGPEQVQELSPEALLVRVRPTLSRRAEQSDMDLIVSADLEDATARGVRLSVDPHAVERILMNLIENACKYAGPGEDDDEADPRIHLDVRVAGGQLELLVADYGPGIAARDRARIFGEFQRGATRLTRSGLGLGLALSRGLAREAGGDLRLVRRRGHGAEFLLTIPVREPEAPGRSQSNQ